MQFDILNVIEQSKRPLTEREVRKKMNVGRNINRELNKLEKSKFITHTGTRPMFWRAKHGK